MHKEQLPTTQSLTACFALFQNEHFLSNKLYSFLYNEIAFKKKKVFHQVDHYREDQGRELLLSDQSIFPGFLFLCYSLHKLYFLA